MNEPHGIGDDEDFLLLTPGPVPLDQTVRDAMGAPMVSHRSVAFEAVYEQVQEGLETVFEHSTLDGSRTSDGGTAMVLNGTATMAMEAAVSNLVGPGDEVVALVNGKFGRRFGRIADRYANCTRVEANWGDAFDLDTLRSTISEDTSVVTMVHNETSTGLLNPVERIGEIAADNGATFIVDGVTSVGGDVFQVDDWNVDVAIVGSQKALAGPPGLSAIYVTDRVIDALDGDQGPFYHDLVAHRRKASENQTPYTSAVPLYRAMAVALDRLLDEGLPTRIERHRRYAAAFRAGFSAYGLELFPTTRGDSKLSNTVTAVSLPEAIQGDPDPFFDAVASRGVAIAGGQAHLDGDIFRVSNMGDIGPEAVERGVNAIGEALVETGVSIPVDEGVAATRAQL